MKKLLTTILCLLTLLSVSTASVGTSAATRMWATRCVRDITTNYVGYGFTMSTNTATWLPKAVLATGGDGRKWTVNVK